MADNGALTRKDLEECLANVATKDDLKAFPTADDPKNFATKDDLKNFATKDDLKNFATKDELERMGARLAKSILDLGEKFDKLAEGMPTKNDLDRWSRSLEKSMGRFEVQEKRLCLQGNALGDQGDLLDLHERRINRHEARIGALEARPLHRKSRRKA